MVNRNKTRKQKQRGSGVPENNNNNIDKKEGTITITALIKKLDKIHKAKGNLPVFVYKLQEITHVEFDDTGGWEKVHIE
jgi:hypothetical protein